jgi:cytoskeletal protein CcmA (bactofilin family)
VKWLVENQAHQVKKDIGEEKLKYARGAYLNGRRSSTKDGVGFQKGGTTLE